MPLRLNNVSKAFGTRQVLTGFTMEAAEGERVSITGPSGGGKTTILNIIAGLVTPDSGEVEVPEGKVSYVFQEYRLLPWLTAEENITAAAGCTKEYAREVLRAVELWEERKGYPEDFSGGMKQRVNIARALAADSKVILLDEPFKGLDPELRSRVTEKVLEYSVNRTVILVTHDRAECEMMECGKIYEL